MRKAQNRTNSYRDISFRDQRLLERYLVQLWRDDTTRSNSEKRQDAKRMVKEAFITFSDGYNPKQFGFDRWISIIWQEGPIAFQGFTINGNGPLVQSFARRRFGKLPYHERIKRIVQCRYYTLKYRVLFRLGSV